MSDTDEIADEIAREQVTLNDAGDFEKAAGLGLVHLARLFDVAVVPVWELPKLSVVLDTIANGSCIEELLHGLGKEPLPDHEASPTIWVVQDMSGFHAAVVGPQLGLHYEAQLMSSGLSIRLPSCKYADLAQVDLRSMLHRTGSVLTDGWALLMSRDKPIATLVTLERLVFLCGVDQVA